MTKTALYIQARGKMLTRIQEGKTAPSVYPSWSKAQLQAYIEQFSDQLDGKKMDIPGTVHGRRR